MLAVALPSCLQHSQGESNDTQETTRVRPKVRLLHSPVRAINGAEQLAIQPTTTTQNPLAAQTQSRTKPAHTGSGIGAAGPDRQRGNQRTNNGE